MKNNHWHEFPTIKLPAPVLALAAGNGILWAGGTGGIARYQTEWQSLKVGFPLSFVSTLCYRSGWVLAGGTEGIARSNDNGDSWQFCALPGKSFPVGAIVPSPNFEQDSTFLTSTLGGGVLRSKDSGQTWNSTNLGLKNFEVLSLAWRDDDIVLAATTNGIYRSTDGGCAWEATEGTENMEVATVLFLEDGSALTLLDDGRVLLSQDSGACWQPHPSLQLPSDVYINTLLYTKDQTWLIGAAEKGTLYSTDNGTSWEQVDSEPALSCALSDGKIYAGLPDGVAVIENGKSTRLPLPPMHDLSYLLVNHRHAVVAGLLSGIWRWGEHDAWETLPVPTSTVLALAETPDGALILSGPEGIQRSADQGTTWQICLEGEAGLVTIISFRSDGWGWAGSADGKRLLRSRDQGLTWEVQQAPFGGIPLVALQASEKMIFGATYDPQTLIVQLWYSENGGQTWRAGANARHSWPVINTLENPAIISLGGLIYINQPDNTWSQFKVGSGLSNLRRLVGNSETLFALTNSALLRSDAQNISWTVQTDCPPVQQIINIVMDRKKLYLLLSEGRVWSRPL